MEILKAIMAFVLAVAVQLSPFFSAASKDLGIPTADRYSEEQILARSVWDMAVQDGVLYVGAGDYDANTGPTPIWAYDIDKGVWTVSATVNDEAVSRFCVFEDTLLAPGIDAVGTSWEYGNYHILDGGQWTSIEDLPGAVHNFDITRFEGSRFFALGTADGEASPVLASADGRTDFRPIPFYKDGATVLDGRYSFIRVYDFFAFGERLYCYFCGYREDGTVNREFFEYADGCFTYLRDADLDYFHCKQMPVCGKISDGETQYFTTGKLYRTDDFQTVTPVELPDDGFVADLCGYELGERRLLYALSNIPNDDGTYTATVYLLNDGITAVAGYTAQAPALSLVRDGAYFYIGLGGAAGSPDTGAVIRLSALERLTSE